MTPKGAHALARSKIVDLPMHVPLSFAREIGGPCVPHGHPENATREPPAGDREPVYADRESRIVRVAGLSPAMVSVVGAGPGALFPPKPRGGT